jgi:hypothetical protein
MMRLLWSPLWRLSFGGLRLAMLLQIPTAPILSRSPTIQTFMIVHPHLWTMPTRIVESDLNNAIALDKNKKTVTKLHVTETHAVMTLTKRAEFIITSWPKPPAPPAGNPTWGNGLAANPCCHQDQRAKSPGFAIFTWDPWYNANPGPYDYSKPYKKGSNGS